MYHRLLSRFGSNHPEICPRKQDGYKKDACLHARRKLDTGQAPVATLESGKTGALT